MLICFFFFDLEFFQKDFRNARVCRKMAPTSPDPSPREGVVLVKSSLVTTEGDGRRSCHGQRARRRQGDVGVPGD